MPPEVIARLAQSLRLVGVKVAHLQAHRLLFPVDRVAVGLVLILVQQGIPEGILRLRGMLVAQGLLIVVVEEAERLLLGLMVLLERAVMVVLDITQA